jgi:DNA polymerase I-like protein with 3'-5' exonuclease and polymerase domains
MAEELDVKFIDSEYIEALKAKCSPAQFMDPYDAEKVSIANKIYAKLMNNLEDIEALEEIEKEIEAQLS